MKHHVQRVSSFAINMTMVVPHKPKPASSPIWRGISLILTELLTGSQGVRNLLRASAASVPYPADFIQFLPRKHGTPFLLSRVLDPFPVLSVELTSRNIGVNAGIVDRHHSYSTQRSSFSSFLPDLWRSGLRPCPAPSPTRSRGL